MKLLTLLQMSPFLSLCPPPPVTWPPFPWPSPHWGLCLWITHVWSLAHPFLLFHPVLTFPLPHESCHSASCIPASVFILFLLLIWINMNDLLVIIIYWSPYLMHKLHIEVFIGKVLWLLGFVANSGFSLHPFLKMCFELPWIFWIFTYWIAFGYILTILNILEINSVGA